MRFWLFVAMGLFTVVGCKGDKDADGDGAIAGFDCDDEDPMRSPYMDEVCDGIDNDCDQLVDADDPGVLDADLRFVDADGDGFGAPDSEHLTCDLEGTTTVADDCDDSAQDVHPEALEVCEDGVDNDCDGMDAVCAFANVPLAPSAFDVMLQNTQTAFEDDDGAACDVHLTLAVGDQAVCYASNEGALFCAGRIYTETYGSTFVDTGLTDVEQVFIAGTMSQADGNAAVVLSGGVPTSIGFPNQNGQLGTGDSQPVTTWTPWVNAPARALSMATGTMGQVCARSTEGAIWCTGGGYGSIPSVESVGPHDGYYVDTFGSLHTDDPDVWRMSSGRADCRVGATGLACSNGQTLGTPHHVVDGGMTRPSGDIMDRVVWLEDDGTVHQYVDHALDGTSVTRMFVGATVLAIGYTSSTDTVCAVPNDGSLWCIGSNDQGKVGNGTLDDLGVETEVAGPGTFDVSCR